jgi:hypothetical protein
LGDASENGFHPLSRAVSSDLKMYSKGAIPNAKLLGRASVDGYEVPPVPCTKLAGAIPNAKLLGRASVDGYEVSPVPRTKLAGAIYLLW